MDEKNQTNTKAAKGCMEENIQLLKGNKRNEW